MLRGCCRCIRIRKEDTLRGSKYVEPRRDREKKKKKKKRKKKKEEQEEETSLKHPSLSSIIGEIRSSARAGTDCATKPANVRPANERNGLINLNDSLSLRYECIRNP